jgi:hypothetical protein
MAGRVMRAHQDAALHATKGRAEDVRKVHPDNSRYSLTSVLALQRSAGNHATTLLLQRTPKPDGTITDQAELERLRPVGGSVDVETRDRVMETLLAAPRSRRVLDAIAKLRGDLNFPLLWSARGDFHSAGAISLDRRKNEAHWLAEMAHEIVHLHVHLAGKSANVKTMGREEYVNTQMAEEIGAHAAAYVTQLQLGRTTSSSAGYSEFLTLMKKDHAELIKKQDWAAIEALAKPFVEQKYKKEWVGSKTGKNYYDKWRGVWDAANPSK